MATVTAFEALYDRVVPAMALRVDGLESPFGWREGARQMTSAARVVWTPGDETGSLGQELAAQMVTIPVEGGQTARNLVDLDEAFHVQIQAVDQDNLEVERAQYNKVRMLYDVWRACVWRATHDEHRVGFVTLVSARWKVDGPNEKRHGACLIVTGRVRSPIPDDAIASAQPKRIEIKPAAGDIQGATIVVE